MLTRRRFLTQSGLLFAAASAAPSFLTRASSALAAGPASSRYGDDTTLVVVQMSGGNDGINTVVPYGMDGYRQARPNIGIAEDAVLSLTSSIGLHPQMGKIRDLYQAGNVAIVQGAGYPNPILSHFQSMDVWQHASPDGSRHDGWLADYLATTGGAGQNLMYAASVTDSLNPALQGPGVMVPSIASLQTYQFRADARYPNDREPVLAVANWMYGQSYGSNALEGLVARTASAALSSVAEVQNAAKAYSSPVQYPNFPLANSLKTVAELMAANLGTRIYYVAFGGFDTHSAQANTHNRLLGGFSDSIDAFLSDVAQQGKSDKTLLMTFSEFGRRVQENASQGTDHGTAAPMFVFGSQVKGGLYGEYPSLVDLDGNRNLKYSVDFRSVYGTVLEGWLGADQHAALGGRYENLGLV
jgi:uncharacterized protein (DUF1501 family)